MRISSIAILCTLLISVIAISPATPAHAADSFGPFSRTLSQINRIHPLQNPYFIGGQKILNRDIVDNKHKTVGDLQDVVLSKNGKIETLNITFDRLHLPSTVSLDYEYMGVTSETNNYSLALASNKIEDIYPQLLANISPASGGSDAFYSLENMIGSRVQSQSGRRIGKIKEVLFNPHGNQIEALFVEITSGFMRGNGIAIPYEGVDIQAKGRAVEVTLSKSQTKAFWDFAKSQK